MLKLVFALLFLFTPMTFPTPRPKLPKPHCGDGGKKKLPPCVTVRSGFITQNTIGGM